MRIIIGGAGRIGFELARTLRLQNHDVVLIDNDARAIKNAQQLDVLVISGDITSREKLQEAGINTARVFIATTESDEINLIASMLAEHEHNLKEKNKQLLSIVRVRSQKYVDEQNWGHLVEWAKVNFVIDPTDIMIERLHAGLTSAQSDQVVHYGHGAYIVEIDIAQRATHLIGLSNKEIKEKSDVDMPPIIAIKKRDGRMFLYDPSYHYEFGDVLAVSTIGIDSLNTISTVYGHIAQPYPDTPKVVVFGAGSMGQKIVADWLDQGAKVTVIERNLHLANQLVASKSGENPDLEVIHGDHLDKNILSEISIENYDFAISALSDDHDNIAACLLAADKGVTRTGLILYDSDLVRVTKRMGITYAVDRSQVAVDQILNIIHTNESGSYGKLSELSDYAGLSVNIDESSKLAGANIEDLKKLDWMRVAFIQRRNLAGEWESFLPKEKKAILEGDKLIVFTDHSRANSVQKKI